MIKLVRLVLIILIGITIVTYCAHPAHSDDVYLTGALGVFNSGKSSLSETKFANVGYRIDLGWFKQQVELGGWIDRVPGRSGSAYGAYQVGWEVDNGLIARVMTGPAFITTPDDYLGGRLEFKEDLYLGCKDVEGRTFGVKYNHLSSAGIYAPNIGRDFFGLEIGVRF